MRVQKEEEEVPGGDDSLGGGAQAGGIALIRLFWLCSVLGLRF